MSFIRILIFINAYSYEHITLYSLIVNNIEILHRSRKHKLITINEPLSRPEFYDSFFEYICVAYTVHVIHIYRIHIYSPGQVVSLSNHLRHRPTAAHRRVNSPNFVKWYTSSH